MTTLDEIEAAALQLEPEQRSLLVNRLSKTLEVSDDDLDIPPLDPGWIEEAKRRLRELDDGTVQPIDGDEVMKRLWDLAKS